MALLFLSGCQNSSDPNSTASPAPTTPTKTAKQPTPTPNIRDTKKATRVPELLSSEDVKTQLDERKGLAVPSASDLRPGERPFEGSKRVRQRLLNPLPKEVTPDVVSLVEQYLTFDPQEPEQVAWSRQRRTAKELVRMEAFSAIEGIADTLRSKRLLSQNGSLLLGQFYGHLSGSRGTDLEKNISIFERWLKLYPESIAARFCLANAYTSWAWQARGVDVAANVTPEGWKLFRERLTKAQDTLVPIAEQTDDPYPDCLAITISMGLQTPKSVVRKHLTKALSIEPHQEFMAYSNYAHYLLPRWAGSNAERAEFINEMVRNTQPELGLSLYALLMAEPDQLEVDEQKLLQGYQDLVDRNPACVNYFKSYARQTLKVKGPEATLALYTRLLDGDFKIPLTEGQKLRLKDRLTKSFGGKTESPKVASSNRASMLGIGLGMTRQEVEELRGKPSYTGPFGANATELHYRNQDGVHSIILSNSDQKVTSTAGASCEVKGQTLKRGMTYEEVQKLIGAPDVVRRSRGSGSATNYFLVYPNFELSVNWNAKNERAFIFTVREDIRASVADAPPVTLEEWNKTWKRDFDKPVLEIKTKSGHLVKLPSTWDYSGRNTRYPTFKRGLNELQLTPPPENQKPKLPLTQEGLVELASGLLYRRDMLKVLEKKSGKCSFGLYGEATYEASNFKFIQVRYLSKGQDILVAKYYCKLEPAPGDLDEVEAMLNTLKKAP